MSKQKEFSYTKGFFFSFEEGGNKIEAWFSALSGLEKVYVDGELVSSQRNLSTNSTNTCKVGQNEYSTNLQVISLFKGPFICTLNKNGEVYKRQKLVFPRAKNTYREYLFAIGIGVAFGVAFVVADIIWNFQKETWYFYLVAVFGIVFLYKLNLPCCKPVIEEERIE